MGRSGSVSPRKWPIATDSPCTRNDGDADAGQHHPPSMTQCVRHGDQLRLVAEFGEEHDREADQYGGEHWMTTFRRVADGPKCSRPVRHSVEGLAHRLMRFAGRALRQYVDTTIGGYSPSLTPSDDSGDCSEPPAPASVRGPESSFRKPNQLLRKPLCGKEHRQDRSVGMADRIDADPADHRRDRAVGFRLHPGGPVLQTQVRKPGQQYATRCGTRSTPAVTAWSPTADAASAAQAVGDAAKYPGGTADSPTTVPSASTSPTVPGSGSSGSSSRAPKIVVVESNPGSDATRTATINSCAHSLVESGQRPETTNPLSEPREWNGSDLDRPTEPHLHLASAPSVFGIARHDMWVDLSRMRTI